MFLAGVALHAAVAAQAGEPPGLREGARVRTSILEGSRSAVENKLKRLTGTLVGIDDSTLRLETSRDEPPVVLARQDVARIEVSVRRSRRGKGALIGLGVGAVVGIALMVAANSGGDDTASCPPPPPGGFLGCFDLDLDFSGPEYYAGTALVLGAAGAGIGALVAPGEKWEDVPGDRLRLAVGPTRGGGVKLGVSFTF